jgi:hypothetical protein
MLTLRTYSESTEIHPSSKPHHNVDLGPDLLLPHFCWGRIHCLHLHVPPKTSISEDTTYYGRGQRPCLHHHNRVAISVANNTPILFIDCFIANNIFLISDIAQYVFLAFFLKFFTAKIIAINNHFYR